MKLEIQVTGNIGLYYTCYRLSRFGWNVMPTARNARGIDIIAYNKEGTKYIGIQVKTLSKRNPVPLGNSLDKVMGDYWIIVNDVLNEPNAFILLPNEIKELAIRERKRAGCHIGYSQILMMLNYIKRHGIELVWEIIWNETNIQNYIPHRKNIHWEG